MRATNPFAQVRGHTVASNANLTSAPRAPPTPRAPRASPSSLEAAVARLSPPLNQRRSPARVSRPNGGVRSRHRPSTGPCAAPGNYKRVGAMVGAPGRVGTWRPARQATPHLVYTFVYDSDVDSPRL